MNNGSKGLIACLCLALCTVVPARADDSGAAVVPTTMARDVAVVAPAAVADPVRDLITRQMDAIRARDADAAFERTTAAFHEHYDTPRNFLSHVRFEYRALYNHKGFSFLDRHEIEGGGVLQKVSVEDGYGSHPVTVIFRLQKGGDGQWLIDSFTILGGGGDSKPI